MRVFPLAPRSLPAPQAVPQRRRQISWKTRRLGQGSLRFGLVLGPFLVRITEGDCQTFLFTENQDAPWRILALTFLLDRLCWAFNGPGSRPVSSVTGPPVVSGASHSTSQPRSAQQLGHAATAAASQGAAAASCIQRPASDNGWLHRALLAPQAALPAPQASPPKKSLSLA